MRKIIAIVVCKLAAFVGKLIGKGSSKPGALALKICPDIISRLQLPETIVAVTGSNGKTSTVELAVKILRESGMNICWNKEGSNQTEGIATMLICNATLGGKVKADAVVMESDERYARLTFRFLKPTHFVILNILRDQMTRNGHPEFICEKIADAVSSDMKVIVNADDPMSVLAAAGAELVGFGVAKGALSSEGKIGVYDDGVTVPHAADPLNTPTVFRVGWADIPANSAVFPDLIQNILLQPLMRKKGLSLFQTVMFTA